MPQFVVLEVNFSKGVRSGNDVRHDSEFSEKHLIFKTGQ